MLRKEKAITMLCSHTKNVILKTVFLTACGLKCYHCSSSISFEDCIRQQEEKDCNEEYKCGKSRYKYKKQKDIYSLSCSSNMHCNDPAYMCRVSTNFSNDCELTCCDRDLCNTGSTLVAVGVICILLTWLLASIIIMT